MLLALALAATVAPSLLADSADRRAPELWIPPGVEDLPGGEDELRAALDDDLDSGLPGALPVAFIAAMVELEPKRYGASIQEAYRRYGFVTLGSRPRVPVGMVEQVSLGIRVHQFNCLACHAAVDPLPGPKGERRLVIGAPNRSVDFSGWFFDLFSTLRRRADAARAATGGPDTGGPDTGSGDSVSPAEHRERTSARLLAEVLAAARRGLQARGQTLGAADRLVLGALTRNAVADSFAGRSSSRGPVRYGAGRTVVHAAYRTIRFGLDPGPYAPIKPPDLFGVRFRQSLLWGGQETYEPGTTPAERIARNGMLVPWIQINPFTRKPISDRLTLQRAPRYLAMGRRLALATPPPVPLPDAATRARMARGRRHFERSCALCHGSYELDRVPRSDGSPGLRARPVDYEESLIPAAELGVDQNFTRTDRPDFRRAFLASGLGRAGLFKPRITKAFVPRPLLGLRLRAPYLHNGSIPNLAALLTPPSERPRRFVVGRAVPYDPRAVGLKLLPVEDVPDAEEARIRAGLFVRDGERPGNQPSGHPFGTELSPTEKAELIEFLKRL